MTRARWLSYVKSLNGTLAARTRFGKPNIARFRCSETRTFNQVCCPLIGLVLLIGAARLFWPRELHTNAEPRDPPVLPGMLCGAGIGLLSGLTGTGGGIFLSPSFFSWDGPQQSPPRAWRQCSSSATRLPGLQATLPS